MIETALSTLSPIGDVFSIQESKTNPYFHSIEYMTSIEIKSLKELCEKNVLQLRKHN